jgi:hemerythrin
MNEILQRVMESVKSYFAREEKFLFDSGYPDATAYQSEQDLILKTGLELQARFRNSSLQ